MLAMTIDVAIASTARPVPFPEGFVWGSTTSSYQIEGTATQDGAGRASGTVSAPFRGDQGRTDGAVACDHYHRRRRIALMGGST